MTMAHPTDPATAGERPLVSVIIVNWNGRPYLEACVSSVLSQTYPSLEVLVVDNGSMDGSVAWLTERFAPRIRILPQDKNHGFAEGVNIGLRAAHGHYVALLNNDAVADAHWIVEMVKAVESKPSVGMCACKILFQHAPNVIDKVGHLMYPDGLNAGRGLGEPDRGQYDRMEEVLFPDGCAALYKRAVFDQAGLFDAQFFAYGDDADLGLRARWLGWECLYMPTAIVYHRHSATLGKYSPQKAFLVERNRVWLACKLFPGRLLWASPYHTLVRFFWQAYAALRGVGSAGQFSKTHSRTALIGVLIKAYASALCGLPEILGKRRAVLARRKLSNRDFIALLRRHRASARNLALQER